MKQIVNLHTKISFIMWTTDTFAFTMMILFFATQMTGVGFKSATKNATNLQISIIQSKEGYLIKCHLIIKVH